MNGDNDYELDAFQPSFMEDGGGISGIAPQNPPFIEDTTDYFINPSTELPVESETIDPSRGDDSGGGNALPPSVCLIQAGSPPGMGTWVLGSIDGTCQWIDTTVCP